MGLGLEMVALELWVEAARLAALCMGLVVALWVAGGVLDEVAR